MIQHSNLHESNISPSTQEQMIYGQIIQLYIKVIVVMIFKKNDLYKTILLKSCSAGTIAPRHP